MLDVYKRTNPDGSTTRVTLGFERLLEERIPADLFAAYLERYGLDPVGDSSRTRDFLTMPPLAREACLHSRGRS
jgi:hypothetical protein